MYLKIESVSGVQITSPTLATAAVTGAGSSESAGRSQDAKIPVPMRQMGGGASAAATADAGTACTPDEIYCYTQFNASRAPNYSHHFYPAASYGQHGAPHHYLNQQSAVRSRYPYPDAGAIMSNYNVSNAGRRLSAVDKCSLSPYLAVVIDCAAGGCTFLVFCCFFFFSFSRPDRRTPRVAVDSAATPLEGSAIDHSRTRSAVSRRP